MDDRPRDQSLTPVRATALVVGAGAGAGIMAVPAIAARVGLPGLVAVLLAAYLAATYVHLMLVEVLLRTGRPLQVIELMSLWVFDRPARRPLLWLTFGLLVVAFVAVLAAYVAAEADIVVAASGLEDAAAQALVYLVSAGVVFFGLGAVGRFESVGVVALVGCVVALVIGAAGVPLQLDLDVSPDVLDWLALFGLVMYGYYAIFSVPQVVKGLAPDGVAAARAVMAGLAINGALMAAVAFVALSIGEEVTEVAIVGIAERLGPWAGGIGGIFVFVALLTSYWAVSLALADIIVERLGLGFRLSWLLATLPSLLLLYAGAMGFVEWLGLAAGLTALVIAFVTVPMYRNARRGRLVTEPDWSLGRWGSTPLLALALLATVLMATGSLLEA